MPSYEVSIDPVSDLQGAFDIECITDIFLREIRHRETLLHSEKFIVFEITQCNRHTGAIMSNTLSECEDFSKSILDSEKSSFSHEDLSLMFDNSGKHS